MNSDLMANHRYSVVGGGAIGGTLAAHLAIGGHEVQIIDADRDHVNAIQEGGLRIESPDEVLSVEVPTFHISDAPAELGFVLLAVKAQATRQAIEWIAPRLPASGCVASMQNGLNEAAIAERIGHERTIAAFVDLFADVVAPGVIKDGGIGTIALGEFGGGVSERVERLADDLAHWGEPVVTNNVRGFLWSKLAFGAMLTATAFIDADMAEVVDVYRHQMTALAREVFSVADALEIQLESFDAFSPDDFRDGVSGITLNSAFDALTSWLAGQTKTRSGIWRDINVRKRPTEVPSQYEPVVEIAEKHGIATPCLREMIHVIEGLERREVSMGPALMKRIKQ